MRCALLRERDAEAGVDVGVHAIRSGELDVARPLLRGEVRLQLLVLAAIRGD